MAIHAMAHIFGDSFGYTARPFISTEYPSPMWFRNLVPYRLEKVLPTDPEQWQEALATRAFVPCGNQQPMSMGWVPPLAQGSGQLSHGGSGFTLLTARREERLLPAGVIREAVDEKVEVLETAQDRRVGRKERRDIQDEVVFDLMPRAFTRSRTVSGLILHAHDLLLIDSASRARAEEWLHLLRESIGSLPLRPVNVRNSPVATLTGWLSDPRRLPAGVELGDQCELRSPLEDGATVRISKQDLGGEETGAHLEAGKLAFKLALQWHDSLSFVLTDKLEVKRLRFDDVLMEQASQDGSADAAAEFDAAAHLMAMELSRLLPALWDLLGGLAPVDDGAPG